MWGLPSRSVAGPLVRSYRTFSPLPESERENRGLAGLTPIKFTALGRFNSIGVRPARPDFPSRSPAVCFLWHFPSLTGPRVTRHTALRSSDFPRQKAAIARLPATIPFTILSHLRISAIRQAAESGIQVASRWKDGLSAILPRAENIDGVRRIFSRIV